MDSIFNQLYSPAELAELQNRLQQRYQEGALQNQNLNTAASMAKNLSPAANLGMLIGTLAGKWGAQRLNNIYDARIDKGANLENLFQKGLQPSLRNIGREIYKTPTSLESAPPLTPQNTGFAPNNIAPSTALNPPTTNFVANNAAPSTSFFANNMPFYDWRNQNYLTHTVTRPSYLSVR